MAAEPPAPHPAAGEAPPPDAREPDAVLSRRAQLLATEHWGLLAARSTAQSEVLTRITIFLLLVSASLVTLGLMGQATRFEGWFAGAAVAILGFVAIVGLITTMRVFNVSEEDLMYVVAMNRIRAAYVDLDAEVARYFLDAVNDDETGLRATYSFLRPRGPSHLFGSSAVLITFVEACMLGLFAGSIVAASGGSMGWAVAVGVVVGVIALAWWVLYGAWTYRYVWRTYTPLRPTPEARVATRRERSTPSRRETRP